MNMIQVLAASNNTYDCNIIMQLKHSSSFVTQLPKYYKSIFTGVMDFHTSKDRGNNSHNTKHRGNNSHMGLRHASVNIKRNILMI